MKPRVIQTVEQNDIRITKDNHELVGIKVDVLGYHFAQPLKMIVTLRGKLWTEAFFDLNGIQWRPFPPSGPNYQTFQALDVSVYDNNDALLAKSGQTQVIF